jgi:hypothetical protein
MEIVYRICKVKYHPEITPYGILKQHHLQNCKELYYTIATANRRAATGCREVTTS